MSALGQKQTFAVQTAHAALPLKADMRGALRCPLRAIADSCTAAKDRYSITSSAWAITAADIVRPSAFAVLRSDHELKFNRPFNRQIGRADPLENLVYEISLAAIEVR